MICESCGCRAVEVCKYKDTYKACISALKDEKISVGDRRDNAVSVYRVDTDKHFVVNISCPYAVI